MDYNFIIFMIAFVIGSATVLSLLWMITTLMVWALVAWNNMIQSKLRGLARAARRIA
jgi:hypothetical protein